MDILEDSVATLIFDASEGADYIEMRYGQLMEPYAKGYYLKSIFSKDNKEPIFLDGENYYKHVYNKTEKCERILLNNIADIEEFDIIYDKNGKVVFDFFHIPKKVINNMFTKDSPNTPWRGMEFILDYIDSIVHNELTWGDFPKRTLSELVEKHFVKLNAGIPQSKDKITEIENLFYSYFAHIRNLVYDFMGDDLTNRYEINRKSAGVEIHKLKDYRIYEYDNLLAQIEELKSELKLIKTNEDQ